MTDAGAVSLPTAPAVIHRIWLGGAMLPGYDHGAAWRDMLPGWDHVLWGDGDLAGWSVSPLLERAGRFAPRNDVVRWKVDVFRLAVLFEHGGVYVDCDTVPLRPLDGLLDVPFVAQSPNDLSKATNAVMGFPPRHPYIGAMLDGLEDRVKRLKGRRVVEQVGGFYLTELLPAHRDVRMLPWWLFAGRSIRDRRRGIGRDRRNITEGYVDHTYLNTARKQG